MSWFWTMEIACCYVAANGGQCVCGIWVYLGHQGAVAGCEDKDQNGRRRPNLLLSTTTLLSPQATVKVSQHLPISYGLYSQVWSLTRLVRTHSRKHWCFGDLTDSTLADDDAKIKSFEDSSFKASLAFAFLQFSDRARGYPPIPLRKNSAKI